MPTAVARNPLRWLVHEPWGKRTFLVLLTSPLPHEIIARELGIPSGITAEAVEAMLRGRSWDPVQRNWQEDPRPGNEPSPPSSADPTAPQRCVSAM